MRTIRWLMAATLGLLLTGCAGMNTAPTPDALQALAPTGKLRVGLFLENPLSVVRDSASGEMKGVGFDLGKELARRMGIPFEPVVYPSSAALVGSVTSGQWDVTFLTVSARRDKDMDFTAPYLQVERGYLIPMGSSISTLADVDRRGIRVAVTEKTSSDIFLSRALKNAVLVRASGIVSAVETLKSGRADVFAAGKPTLFELSSQLPGSRVLDGRFAADEEAMAMPKGRDLGMAYARKFIEDAKFEGLVKAAMERAGLRGAVVAPLK